MAVSCPRGCSRFPSVPPFPYPCLQLVSYSVSFLLICLCGASMLPSTSSLTFMSLTTGVKPGSCQELGTQFGSPMWMAGVQPLQPLLLPPRTESVSARCWSLERAKGSAQTQTLRCGRRASSFLNIYRNKGIQGLHCLL